MLFASLDVHTPVDYVMFLSVVLSKIAVRSSQQNPQIATNLTNTTQLLVLTIAKLLPFSL